MTSSPTSQKFTVHMIDAESTLTVRTILKYEARLRGRSIGQTCTELIMEAVDVDSYPPEVKGRLTEIRREAQRRAVQKSLSMVDLSQEGFMPEDAAAAPSEFDEELIDGPQMHAIESQREAEPLHRQRNKRGK